MWREGAAALTSAAPVKFRRVLVATALNPKAVVFAFVIVPHLAAGQVRAALPYVGALIVMIALVGSAWIGVGAAFFACMWGPQTAGLARRGGALALCAFAALISGSAFSA